MSKILVNSESYPNIVEAMNCMADDTGGMTFPVHEVPKRWEPYLGQLEETFGGLSRKERAPESEPLPPHVKPSELLDSEFYAFCNGEFTEQSAIANRDINHARASVFLNDFFEDWTYTADDGADVPANKTVQYRLEWLNTVEKESSLGLSPEQREEQRQLQFALT